MPRDPQPTRTRLLDAAEKLFAQRGFHAVSVRDITKAARADVSLVHYHFGSMDELLAQVVERRAAMLNRVRLDALESIQRARRPAAPSAEEVLGAFANPLLDLFGHADAGWKHYFALIAQVNNSPQLAALMNTHFNACVQRFIDALTAALPDSDPADIYWGYHFMSGALTLTFADTGRIDELSHGLCRSSDTAAIYPRYAAFFSGGFKELAGRTATRAPRKVAARVSGAKLRTGRTTPSRRTSRVRRP